MANALGDVSATMAYQDKSNAVRWVDQENYHLTLAFLGDQLEEDLEELAGHLDEHLLQAEFSVSISHLSPFPERKPKLLAAMIARNDILREMHQQVIAAMRASPVRVDKRRFTPHITLGRYRHTKNQYSGAIPRTLNLSGLIKEVSIFESTLTPNGAEYQAIFRYPLDQFEYGSCDLPENDPQVNEI